MENVHKYEIMKYWKIMNYLVSICFQVEWGNRKLGIDFH